jgi:15-cis-phytoene synthase
MSSAGSRLAYRQCETVTRVAAGNFYYGIRLLPAPKRRAMCAVYAFARRVDDIADGTLPREEKLRRLDAAARGCEEMHPNDADPVFAALADASIRFRLPVDALTDLIEGVRMDVRGTSYASFAELELYCRRVAGSIGRLCLAIFGARANTVPELEQRATPARRVRERALDLVARLRGADRGGRASPSPTADAADPEDSGTATTAGWNPDRTGRPASELADDLGVALQLANIVRDLREDAERGRVYLPQHDLVRYHLHDDAPLDACALVALTREASMAEPAMVAGFEGGDVGQLYALMRYQCLRSRDFFHRGMELVPLLDRRSAACVLAMAGIYWRLLCHVEERPDRALACRMGLKRREKAWVAARALLGKGIPERHPAERIHEEDA